MFLFTCLVYYIFSEFDLFCNIVQLLLLSVTMTNALSAPFYMRTVYIYIYLYKCCLCNYDSFHNFGLMECETKVKVTNYLCCRFLFWYKWQFFLSSPALLHSIIKSVWIRKNYVSSRQSVLTPILLTWRIWWAPTNVSRWQMKFNSAFKGLI